MLFINPFGKTTTLFAILLSSAAAQNTTTCKCIPSDPCWPSHDDWSTFNDTIQGQLIASNPPAHVCYPGPSYNETACNVTLASWYDSNFHAADPVSIQQPLWSNDSCNPIFKNGTSLTGNPDAGALGCRLGYLPVYAVNATSADIIATAVKWAAQKNIRLVVKNTGHSFTGRSTGFGSLSIWTHNLKGFQFHSDWSPQGCSTSYGTNKQMAAIFGAGIQDREAYALTDQHGAVVVAGSNPSVGLAGWAPGGGHGPLTSTYGMGADNVLEATIVLPSGDIVVANECQHTDLYWAIRGGGSGTFGIIVEITMKAYPSPQTSILGLSITSVDANATNLTSRWWELAAKIHYELPAIKEGGGQGYYQMLAPPVASAPYINMGIYHYDTENETVTALWKNVRTLLDDNKELAKYTFETFTTPSFFALWNASVGQAFEAVAQGDSVLSSRLITKRALTEDVNLVAHTFEKASPIILGHMIANNNNSDLDVALNPAWRDAVTHLVLATGWSDGDPMALQEVLLDRLRGTNAYALNQLCPESGAYFNEADPYEPNWQYTFFGKNYPRLKAIKEKYDPDGVMWCLSCVGSENWVEMENKRLCRPDWY